MAYIPEDAEELERIGVEAVEYGRIRKRKMRRLCREAKKLMEMTKEVMDEAIPMTPTYAKLRGLYLALDEFLTELEEED